MGQSTSNNNVDLIALKGMLGMAIRAVAFDIGGVLEITPDTGMTEKWEQRLHLKPGEMDQRMASVWRDGSLGKCSEEQVQQSLKEIMRMDQAEVDAFMRGCNETGTSMRPRWRQLPGERSLCVFHG